MCEYTYDANRGRGDDPAELPPVDRIVADHVAYAVVEAIDAEGPADGDALEEDEEEQAEARHGVGVQDLEDVHTALGDAREPDEIG